jgi:hypothetical protein
MYLSNSDSLPSKAKLSLLCLCFEIVTIALSMDCGSAVITDVVH